MHIESHHSIALITSKGQSIFISKIAFDHVDFQIIRRLPKIVSTRKVSLMPYYPYDFDNHVVLEIFDRKLNKWIMIDPTTDGLFVDENDTPLSALEIRNKFANAEFVTYVRATDSLKNLQKLKDKYAELNAYTCKNLFYFNVDKDSTFGTTGNVLTFVPNNYSIKAKQMII